jgi:DNA-binding MarR family transcriptional regulator
VANDTRQELYKRLIVVAEDLNERLHTGRLDVWEGLDLTTAQIKTLALLQDSGPLRMGAIALHLDRALSGTTTVVDRLVERGLVERISDPSDRRVVLCQLTAGGADAIAQFWGIGRERIQLVADQLSPEDLENVVLGLETIQRVLADIQVTIESTETAALSVDSA